MEKKEAEKKATRALKRQKKGEDETGAAKDDSGI